MPINSGEHQSHRDIVTHRVRVRTRRVRLLDEHIGPNPGGVGPTPTLASTSVSDGNAMPSCPATYFMIPRKLAA
jgi:hypothetical protein